MISVWNGRRDAGHDVEAEAEAEAEAEEEEEAEAEEEEEEDDAMAALFGLGGSGVAADPTGGASFPVAANPITCCSALRSLR